MEALPIFLDSLVNAWGAILISVTMILLFGEIFPQAICSRYGLAVGAAMTPVVWMLVILFFPITYPISKLLDYLLGKSHVALFRRAELMTLVHMHGNEAGKGGELTHDETTIITGALELTQKTAKDAMTPIASTFSIDVNANLDMKTIHLIMSENHSRVPVYMGTPTNVIGLILEEILDETDEYIDVHERIKVNLLPHGERLATTQHSRSLPTAKVSSLPSVEVSAVAPLSSFQHTPSGFTTQFQAPRSTPAVDVSQNTSQPQPRIILHSLQNHV